MSMNEIDVICGLSLFVGGIIGLFLSSFLDLITYRKFIEFSKTEIELLIESLNKYYIISSTGDVRSLSDKLYNHYFKYYDKK